MTRTEVLAAIKAARKEFKDQMWGEADDVAVDAFIKLLKKQLPKEQTQDSCWPAC